MIFPATLAGITPKAKREGKVIEIKLVMTFSPEVLSDLGDLFNQSVRVDITELQDRLDFDGEETS